MSSKRSPFRRILLIALGALVVLVLAAVLILPRLLDVESYRGSVEQALRNSTGWDAELGEMELSLFPGLALEIQPASLVAPGDGSRLDIEIIRIRAELFPLLSGKLIVHEITLIDPEILIVRNDVDEGWDLPIPEPTPESGDGAGSPVASGEDGDALDAGVDASSSAEPRDTNLDVSIEEVRITGGRMSFDDRAGDPPLSIDLDDVDFVVYPVSGAIRGESGIGDGDAHARWEGTLGKTLVLSFADLPTEMLQPWLGEDLIQPGGSLDGDVEVRWPMEVQGKINAEKLTLLTGERPFDRADLDFHLTTEGEAWNMESLVFDADGVRMTGGGSILPELALRLELPETPLEQTLRMTESVMPLPLDLSPPGTVHADLVIDQKPQGDPQYEIRGGLSAASFRPGEMLPPVEAMRTTFELDRSGALSIRIEEGSIAGGPLSGTARMASIDPPGKLSFDGGVQEAVLGQLLGGMVDDAGGRMIGPTGLTADMGLDLSRETLDVAALTGQLDLDARDVGLPGWDLEAAIREKILEELGSLSSVARLLDGGKKEAGDSNDAPDSETLLDTMQAHIDFNALPWSMSDLALGAGGVEAAGQGTFDPLSGSVDLQVTSRLSREKSDALVARYAEARILVDRNGRISLPMRIEGSMFSPSIHVDLGDILSRSVETEVEDKAKKLLKGLLDRD